MENMIFIDGDFPSEMGGCPFHCSPTCHPMQVGPEWLYGCTHKAWPANKYGDFVPIVDCKGEMKNCDLLKYPKMLGRYKAGKTNSLNHTMKKAAKLDNELNFIKLLKQQILNNGKETD